MNKHPEEESLLPLAMSGDVAAFNTLLSHYRKPIVTFLNYNFTGFDPEELAQEVMIHIWEQMDKYSPSHAFTAWVLTLARRRGIDHVRKAESYGRAKTRFKDQERHSYSIPKMDDEVLANDLKNLIRLCMADLPPLQARALQLVADGYTQREIATMTEAPLGTVKTRIKLGIKTLKKALCERGYERPRVNGNAG